MTKKQKEDQVEVSYKNLEEVIAIANGLILKYPDLTYKDFSFWVDCHYGDDYFPKLEFSRPETDEEYKKRLASEKRMLDHRRMQYEALKKEFEK
jgi:hypothetical protein